MDAEINNVIYVELYSGPKMVHDKYEKTNVARLIDRDSTVFLYCCVIFLNMLSVLCCSLKKYQK
jgi:hypothetical protein